MWFVYILIGIVIGGVPMYLYHDKVKTDLMLAQQKAEADLKAAEQKVESLLGKKQTPPPAA